MNASAIYLLSLQSKTSRIGMKSLLNKVAQRMQGVDSHEECDWSKLTYESVLSITNDLKEEGKSPNTINTYLAAIKGTAKSAWMSKQIDVETYQYIKEVKRVRGSRSDKGRALSSEDVGTFINTCDGSNSSIRNTALLALTYSAGLRRAETAALELKDIDLVNGSVNVLGKGNKAAVNQLNDKVMVLLNKWLKIRGNESGALFTGIRRGGNVTLNGMSTTSIASIVTKRGKGSGVGKVCAHDLRRSFATNLLEADVDIFTVQALMRHSTITSTQVYDKRNSKVKDVAARNISF